MKIIFGVVIVTVLFLISNCKQFKDEEIITSMMEELSKKENCQLAYLDESVGTSNKLTIIFSCEPKDDFFAGKIALDVFELLNEKAIRRDSYSIKDHNGNPYLTVVLKRIKQIAIKKKQFDKHFYLFKNQDHFDGFIQDSLRSKIINEKWYNEMSEKMKMNPKEWEFDGFVFEDRDTVSYVTFGKRLRDEVIIWFSYKFTVKGNFSNDHRIYGLGTIPLE